MEPGEGGGRRRWEDGGNEEDGGGLQGKREMGREGSGNLLSK